MEIISGHKPHTGGCLFAFKCHGFSQIKQPKQGAFCAAHLGKDPRFVSKYSLRPFCTCSRRALHSFSLSRRRASEHSSITWREKLKHTLHRKHKRAVISLCSPVCQNKTFVLYIRVLCGSTDLSLIKGTFHHSPPCLLHLLVSFSFQRQLLVDVIRAEDGLQVEPGALACQPLLQHVLQAPEEGNSTT